MIGIIVVCACVYSMQLTIMRINKIFLPVSNTHMAPARLFSVAQDKPKEKVQDEK